MKRSLQVLGTIAAASLLSIGMVGPAFADAPGSSSSQTVTGTLDTTIGATTDGDGLINLNAGATNVDTDGTVAVESNVAYDLSVVADQATMTRWVDNGYSEGQALGAPLSVMADTAGAHLGVVPQVGGEPLLLASDQAAGAHTFHMTLSQPVSWNDAPGVYRIVLTYTASAGQV